MIKVLTTTLALLSLIGLISAGTLPAADFDGDSRDDIAIFRPAIGLWAVRNVTRVYFGGSSDEPVAGDFSGDGIADIGIFRSGSGLWAIRDLTRAYFGNTGDEPIAGGSGGERLYDYVVKPGDGSDLVAALESDSYGSVFIPRGTYPVTEAIEVDHVQLIVGAGVGNTIIDFSSDGDYLHISSMFCKVEGIYFRGGGDTAGGHGSVYIDNKYVTVESCRSHEALQNGFEYSSQAEFVSLIDCFARNAVWHGFHGNSSINSSRLVNCGALSCRNSGFSGCNNISNGYVDGKGSSGNLVGQYGFHSCSRVSSSYARNLLNKGFTDCKRVSACEVNAAPTGFDQTHNLSACHAFSCTTDYAGCWNYNTNNGGSCD